jgi:alkylation response protein AidB-like acyl-CoA dehydrogenase
LNLFYPEHRDVLRAFYGDDAETYVQLLEATAALLEKEVLPASKEFDSNAGGIVDARKKLFEQGLCRMPFSSNGGMSLPFGVYSLAMELVGAADASTAMSIGIHNTVADGIYRFGSEVQKAGIFSDLIAGRKLASFALTEPSSGSDARSMKTRAARQGSRYVINGSKMFITNAGEADVYLVFAATENGHGAFIVERSSPGLVVGTDNPKLGMRGSRTAEVRFEDCAVPAENLVGKDGEAFEYVKTLLNGSRIVMGSICVGIARLAYRKALDYSAQRTLFNGKLADLQLTREKIADMRSELNASRLLCMYASRLKELGRDYSSEAAQAKVVAAETAVRICDRTIQIFGGYGYTDNDVHRHWRDARLLTIGEGASEVLRMLIATKELAETG